MADLSITAANVGINSDSADVRSVQVGEAVTQGQPGYISANKYYKCENTTAAEANAVVVFLTAASTDGYAMALFSGSYLVGATLTVGETYVVSDTAGGIAPIGDLGSGDYVTILGVASTTTAMTFNPQASGTAKP